jgi:hypothetical protein
MGVWTVCSNWSWLGPGDSCVLRYEGALADYFLLREVSKGLDETLIGDSVSLDPMTFPAGW